MNVQIKEVSVVVKEVIRCKINEKHSSTTLRQGTLHPPAPRSSMCLDIHQGALLLAQLSGQTKRDVVLFCSKAAQQSMERWKDVHYHQIHQETATTS